jgi:hypothetical protein
MPRMVALRHRSEFWQGTEILLAGVHVQPPCSWTVGSSRLCLQQKSMASGKCTAQCSRGPCYSGCFTNAVEQILGRQCLPVHTTLSSCARSGPLNPLLTRPASSSARCRPAAAAALLEPSRPLATPSSLPAGSPAHAREQERRIVASRFRPVYPQCTSR